MKTACYWILVTASFLCGVLLSPSNGTAASLAGLFFAAFTAYLIFSGPSRRKLGIALGLSAACAMAFSSLMFQTVPDAFPPYPPGIMDSLFPAERYPRSEMSFDAIDTRLHWYGLVASLPLMLGLVLIFTRSGQHCGNDRAQQDGRLKGLQP